MKIIEVRRCHKLRTPHAMVVKTQRGFLWFKRIETWTNPGTSELPWRHAGYGYTPSMRVQHKLTDATIKFLKEEARGE